MSHDSSSPNQGTHADNGAADAIPFELVELSSVQGAAEEGDSTFHIDSQREYFKKKAHGFLTRNYHRAKAYGLDSIHFYKENPMQLKTEILSGITIAIMQIPESVAFAFVAGVAPILGLYSTFWMCLITAIFTAKPAMISGMAGATAVVLADVTNPEGPLSEYTLEERVEVLFAIVALCGILELLAGICKLGNLVQLIGKNPMIGFMNGLGIVILMAQFRTFKECPVDDDLCTSGTDSRKEWLSLGQEKLWIMLFYVVCTMLIMFLLPKVKYVGKIIPSSLVGMVFCTVFEHVINRPLIDVPTRTVGDDAGISGALPTFHIPDVPWDGKTVGVIIQYGITVAAVALIESIMTLQAANKLTDGKYSNFKNNQECIAQGLGSLICGFSGALGGDTMIGQTTVNLHNGARGRLSGIIAGLGILIFIVAASSVIELIPLASLAGVLFMVVIHTFNWASLRLFTKVKKIPWFDILVVVTVTTLAVVFNLAIAIMVGVAIEAMYFAFHNIVEFLQKDEGYTFLTEGKLEGILY